MINIFFQSPYFGTPGACSRKTVGFERWKEIWANGHLSGRFNMIYITSIFEHLLLITNTDDQEQIPDAIWILCNTL